MQRRLLEDLPSNRAVNQEHFYYCSITGSRAGLHLKEREAMG